MKFKPDLSEVAGCYRAGACYRNDVIASESELRVRRLAGSPVFALSIHHRFFDRDGQLTVEQDEPVSIARLHAFLPYWHAVMLMTAQGVVFLLRLRAKTWSQDSLASLSSYDQTYAGKKRGARALITGSHIWPAQNQSFRPAYGAVDATARFDDFISGLGDFFDAMNPSLSLSRSYTAEDGHDWRDTLPIDRRCHRLNALGCGLFIHVRRVELGPMPHDLHHLQAEIVVAGLSSGTIDVTLAEELETTTGMTRLPAATLLRFTSDAAAKEVEAVRATLANALRPRGWNVASALGP